MYARISFPDKIIQHNRICFFNIGKKNEIGHHDKLQGKHYTKSFYIFKSLIKVFMKISKYGKSIHFLLFFVNCLFLYILGKSIYLGYESRL